MNTFLSNTVFSRCVWIYLEEEISVQIERILKKNHTDTSKSDFCEPSEDTINTPGKKNYLLYRISNWSELFSQLFISNRANILYRELNLKKIIEVERKKKRKESCVLSTENECSNWRRYRYKFTIVFNIYQRTGSNVGLLRSWSIRFRCNYITEQQLYKAVGNGDQREGLRAVLEAAIVSITIS